MLMESGMPGEPSSHAWRLVRAVVVQNEMHVKSGWNLGVDRVEKLQELLTAMPPVQLADDPTGRHVERREQRCRAVAHVIVRAPFRLARAQRQNRRRAVQRLNLSLFIDRQEQRAIGRAQVQPDDVAHLVNEQRILRQLEGVHAMRLQGKGL